ncbi:MAG TPA: hypothetical protein ENG32_01925 [bacterium]|nr:hypothetical protein [bacterium]
MERKLFLVDTMNSTYLVKFNWKEKKFVVEKVADEEEKLGLEDECVVKTGDKFEGRKLSLNIGDFNEPGLVLELEDGRKLATSHIRMIREAVP